LNRHPSYPSDRYYIQSFEVDIHKSKRGRPSLPDDWYIYHDTIDSKSTVDKLSDAFAIVKSYHERHPVHEVVVVFIDLKVNFDDAAHSPRAFDTLARKVLGDSILYTPSDFLNRAGLPRSELSLSTGGGLQKAVRLVGYPRVDELVGKVMLVFTGSETAQAQYPDALYATAASNPAAFIMPQVSSPSDIPKSSANAVFFNMDVGDATRTLPLAQAVIEAGFLARGYVVNDAKSWATLVHSLNFIATDQVDFGAAPYARTHTDEDGFPFQLLTESENDDERRESSLVVNQA
jgi:hypothetical protein